MNKTQQHEALNALVPEKVAQAIALLDELGIDAWLTFTQEMGDGCDPTYPILFGSRDVGRGLLLLTRSGERIAIVGALDAAIPPSTGAWDTVIVHQGDLRPPLLEVLARLDPAQIAINYSLHSRKADGLSHGDYLRLQQLLAGTPYLDRLTSAHEANMRLRGCKSPGEVALIRAAIARTDEILAELGRFLRPGLTGRQIYDHVLQLVDERGLETSWSRDHCPVVTVGPVPAMGHTPPGQERLERGYTLQVDFGVRYGGLCADFQRMWYVLEEGETRPPAEVQRLFDAIRRGVDAAIAEMRPGEPTWKPAAAATRALVAAGYPENKYGVGHQLGRSVHDGGPSLDPLRPGQPEWPLLVGNVFTAEGLETRIEGRGWVSLEEDVLVTEHGPEVLTNPQRELWLVH